MQLLSKSAKYLTDSHLWNSLKLSVDSRVDCSSNFVAKLTQTNGLAWFITQLSDKFFWHFLTPYSVQINSRKSHWIKFTWCLHFPYAVFKPLKRNLTVLGTKAIMVTNYISYSIYIMECSQSEQSWYLAISCGYNASGSDQRWM